MVEFFTLNSLKITLEHKLFNIINLILKCFIRWTKQVNKYRKEKWLFPYLFLCFINAKFKNLNKEEIFCSAYLFKDKI